MNGRAKREPEVELSDVGPADPNTDSDEVVVGISPIFGTSQTETLNGTSHAEMLRQTLAGIEEEGLSSRVVRVYETADLGVIGKKVATLSGSGIGIGMQARGTTIIHQEDLVPLQNLELFSQAPLLDVEKFRQIGKNAARYAKGEDPSPISVLNDEMVRPKYQAIAAIWHVKEVKQVEEDRPPARLEVETRV